MLALLMISLEGQAQNYLVKTTDKNGKSSEASALSPEDEFISNNFRYYSLCDWKPGMKFMVLPERIDLIVSTFKNAQTGKDVGSADLKYQILEYQGVETTERGWIHFNFMNEDSIEYYCEVKNYSLADYCSDPKKGIKTLAFLGDVDIANTLLIGQTLYTRSEIYNQDDANSTDGFRTVALPLNTPVTVTAVGVGSRSFPVKIIFEDAKGISYFKEVAMSKTNCGMLDSEFIMDNADRLFSKSFGFTDPNQGRAEQLMAQYGNKVVYLRHNTQMNDANGKEKAMKRYTQFVVKSIDVENGSHYVTLHLTDKGGKVYTKKVTFTRHSVTGDTHQSENYFNEVFGSGSLRKLYPQISEKNWAKIEQGEVTIGMSMTECRLALGEPMRIYKDTHSGIQDWIYSNRSILSFKKGRLSIIK